MQLSQRNEMQLMCVFLFHETERVYDGHKNVTNAATVSGKPYYVLSTTPFDEVMMIVVHRIN